LMGIGSILNYWSTRKRKLKRTLYNTFGRSDNLAVWGSGMISDQKLYLPKLKILALRGPLTAKYMGYTDSCAFGDPGILAPYLLAPQPNSGTIGIVPHYSEKFHDSIEYFRSDPKYQIIDVEAPWKNILAHISSCEMILSSSLHGVIVADAYGIPNQRITLSNNVLGGDFKFIDYGLGVGRTDMSAKVIKSPDDILSASRELFKHPKLAEKANVNRSQNALIESIQDWALTR